MHYAEAIVTEADKIEPGAFGTKKNPYLIAPPDFDTAGLPYGAFCCCALCGLVTRSTIAFDYFAVGPGSPLHCQECELKRPRSPHGL